jgi:hypothetical protein
VYGPFGFLLFYLKDHGGTPWIWTFGLSHFDLLLAGPLAEPFEILNAPCIESVYDSIPIFFKSKWGVIRAALVTPEMVNVRHEIHKVM